MATEDDTFNSLKKCSFEEIDRLQNFAPREMSILESRITFAGPENRNKWFIQYGWTDNEYREEAIKRGIMHVMD